MTPEYQCPRAQPTGEIPYGELAYPFTWRRAGFADTRSHLLRSCLRTAAGANFHNVHLTRPPRATAIGSVTTHSSNETVEQSVHRRRATRRIGGGSPHGRARIKG
jgi:hypothetical protein